MAYADKYRFEHKTLYGGDWRHTIQEDGYGGSLHTIDNAEGFDNPVKIEWNGEKDIYTPIIPSFCELNIMAEKLFQFRDLITTNPKKFRLISEYYEPNSQKWLKRWVGYLVPDIYRESFIQVPYPIKIKFIDGIGLLKNIEYTIINQNPERHPVTDVIKQCIDKIDSSRSDPILEFVNIHETSKATPILSDIYVDERAYKKGKRVEQDSSGNNTQVDQYISCYKVLQEICKSFAARFFLSPHNYDTNNTFDEVAWNVWAPNYLGLNTSIRVNNIRTGVAETNDNSRPLSTNPNKNNILLVGEDAELDFYQPRSFVITSYEPVKNDANLIEGGDLEYKDTTSRSGGGRAIKNWSLINSNTEEKWIKKKGGVVLDGFSQSEGIQSPKSTFAANNLTISGEVYQDLFPVKKANKRVDAKFAVIIEDANSNSVYYLNWNSASNWHWVASANTQDLALEREDSFQRDFSFTINSPVTEGFIYVELYGTENQTYTSSQGSKLTMEIDTVWGNINVTPSLDDEIERIKNNAEVDNKANAKPLERTTFHSDGTPRTQLTAFSLDATANPTSTSDWNINGATAYNNDLAHHKILARELLKGYDRHSRRLKGTLLNNHVLDFANMLIVPDNGIDYGFLFYKFSWQLQNSQVKFEAFETLYNITNRNFTDPEDGFYDYVGPVKDPSTKIGPKDGGIDNNTPREFATQFDANFVITPDDITNIIFDPCEESSPQITLPDIAKQTEQITISINCSSCESKTVNININSANNNTTIAGTDTLGCGDTVIITPTQQNTSNPIWFIKKL